MGSATKVTGGRAEDDTGDTALESLLGVMCFPATAEEAAIARRHVRELLGAGHPAVADLDLLLGEALAGLIPRDGRRPRHTLSIAVVHGAHMVRVEIVDDPPDDDARCDLVPLAVLAHRWGPREGGTGGVWFEVAY